MTDELDTLRALAAWNGQTLGATAHDLAEHLGRSVDDVLSDLDRYRHGGLVNYGAAPVTHSLFYTVSRDGELELAERDGTPVPPSEEELDLLAEQDDLDARRRDLERRER